jgi:TonB family protein
MLSVLLHILILLFFFYSFEKVKWTPPQTKEEKITLNLSQFIPPPPKPKPVVIPTKPKAEPIEKSEPKPVIKTSTPTVKKKLLDEKKRVFVEKQTTEENNNTKVTQTKKLTKKKTKKYTKKKVRKHPSKKRVTQKVVKHSKQRKRQKRSKDPLANALMGSGSSMLPIKSSYTPSSRINRMIKQLYGKSFNHFTPAQKEFIKQNLGAIQRITQRTLIQNGYPTVSVQTKQQGVNIVTFYLHPNGNISGLRLKKRMGYAALDKNTLEVIHIAYKDYPLPKSKTKITFYVKYQLY